MSTNFQDPRPLASKATTESLSSTLCAECLVFLFSRKVLLFSAVTAWLKDQVISGLNSTSRKKMKAEALAKR